MTGFKDTTKMQMGHTFSKGSSPPSYAAGSRSVFHKASGGIIAGGMPGVKMNTPGVRPILPRPHVMPSGGMAKMRPMAKLAKGGKVGNRMEGNSLSLPTPYSEVESEHPRDAARPGYAKGGIHIKPSHKGLFTKKMTGSKKGKLTGADVQEGLHSSSGSTRKQANFARMARRGFKPLRKAGGGAVDCDEGQMEQVADRAVKKHVATPPPRGHGVKPKGGLGAFNRTPLIGD